MSSRETATLTDSRGRRIVVRNLTTVEQVRMIRALGPAQSGNKELQMATQIACMTREIDGVPMLYPRDEMTVDAIIERLDDEGWFVVEKWLSEQFATAKATMEAALAGRDDPLERSAASRKTAGSTISSTSSSTASLGKSRRISTTRKGAVSPS